jgi:sigma-E factor negative regulatory protein RseA
MYDEINQNISRLVDGDLSHVETLALLKKMQSDDALKHKMSRYQAISQALKTDQYYQVSTDFSHKIFQAIQQEPAYLLPQLKPQNLTTPLPDKTSRRKLYAVAATSLVAAVLVGQGLREKPSRNTFETVSASAVPQQSLPTALAQSNPAKQRKSPPLAAQFNDYLQAHNNSVYTNGEANFHPYAKVAAYGRE